MSFNWNEFPWTKFHKLDIRWLKWAIGQLKNSMESLGGQVGEQEENIYALQSDMDSVQESIATLDGKCTQVQTNITEIQGDVTQAQTDIDGIEGMLHRRRRTSRHYREELLHLNHKVREALLV